MLVPNAVRVGLIVVTLLAAATAFAKLPVARERLSAADYETQAAELLRQPLPDPAEPVEGVTVTAIDLKGPAAVAGLKPDDVICGVDGTTLIGQRRFHQLRTAATGEQRFDVWSRSAGRRVVTVPPGDLAMRVGDRWLPQVQYLRGLTDGAKAVDELRVAALAARDRGPLAETALARARKAGVAGPDVDLLSAVVAWCEARPDDAIAFATAAAPTLTDARRRSADRILYRSYLATFRWPEALAVSTADPDALQGDDRAYREPVEDLDEAARAAGELPADALAEAVRAAGRLPSDARVADPVKAMDDLNPTDHGHKVTDAAVADPMRAEDATNNKTCIQDLRQFGWYPIQTPSDHYGRCMFGPAGADVDLGVDVKFHRKDDKYSLWHKGVTIALMPADHPGADDEPAIQLLLAPEGSPSLVTGIGLPTCVLSLGQLAPKDVMTHVRITAVGRWCRIAVGRKTVYAGPLAADLGDGGHRRLCGVMQDCGVVGEWRGLRWRTGGGAK
jgi:hypothetical protein